METLGAIIVIALIIGLVAILLKAAAYAIICGIIFGGIGYALFD